MFNIYDADEYIVETPMLKDVSEEIDIYDKTDIDEETAEALTDFFLFDRLCCKNVDKWQWLWRRRINLYYPIYKEQLDVWAKRKVFDWYFDNYKEEIKTHDGKNKTDSTTNDVAEKTVDRIVKDIFKGHTNTNDTSDSEDNGKARSFAFNYPESNYTGGTIPYDLDNNPSYEFINSQADNINKATNHTESKSDTVTNNTDDNTSNEKSNDKSNRIFNQNDKIDWTEKTNRQGDNINQLAKELLEQLQGIDFFKQFTDKLKPCFMNVYLVDEWEQDQIQGGK